MKREEMKQIYNAISTVFEGDYNPEEELLDYDESFSNDDEYFEALAEIFEANDGAEFKAYVDGAKDVILDFYDSEEHLKECYPNEYEILKNNGFFE